MADTNSEPKNAKTYSKRKILICIICLILVASGAFYIWHKNAKKAPENLDVASAVATVDVDKLLPEHPDYAKLIKLQDEKILILTQLKKYMIDDESNQSPEVNPAANVFAQVVDEQDNLRNIKLNQQLKEESAVKENEIRAVLAEDKNKVIKEINDKFLNAILNATIKLDNADNLRLSQEERNELVTALDELKKQRGEAVFKIEQQYNLRVANELMQWRAVREKELGIKDLAAHQADVADSEEKQANEQQRDNAYLQDRLQMLKARKNDSERLMVLLQVKDNEIALLKKNMLKDIASKATKVAIQKHLKLVVANVPTSLSFFDKVDTDFLGGKLLSGMVVGVDAEDITDDVLAELKNDDTKTPPPAQNQ